MGKKDQKKAKPSLVYKIRKLASTGYQGRLGVFEISAAGERLIARYHTKETALWVRDVMEDAVTA